MSRPTATVDHGPEKRARSARHLVPLVLYAECVAAGGLALALRAGMFADMAKLATPLTVVATISGFTALAVQTVLSRRR